MTRCWRFVTCVLIAGGLAGCGSVQVQGLTQLQDSITKFGEGAHLASTAQGDFFRAVQSADCTHQFYARAYAWATGTANTLDISGQCTPTILNDQQIQIRQSMMDAITLYADKMAALATNDDDKTLDANSRQLATNLNGLVKQGGFASLPVAAGVEAGIIAIAELALDQRRFTDLKSAAGSMESSVRAVVAALKQENTAFAIGIASKIDGTELNLREVLAATRKSREQMSFFDVVEARRIMQSVNPFSPGLVAGGVDLKSDPANVAQQLNATLDGVVNANRAIAADGTGGIIAAVNDLIARAKKAQTIQSALNK